MARMPTAGAEEEQVRELERLLDLAVESYDGPEEINNLESAALPNKRAVIEAFDHLKPAIFLGFYSTRPLHRPSLRHALGEHLYPAFALLTEQIRRAVTYEERLGRSTGLDPARVVLDLIGSLPRLRRLLNGDVMAAYEGDPAARGVEEVVFSYPSVEAITAHRIAHELWRAGVPMIPRIISELAHSRTGIDIHAGARIGERFFIDHGTGVVIGETAVIGARVKLYQGVTLGALSVRRCDQGALAAKRHPTLEDDVTVYSGATILGGETVIGAGSVIGANQWVTESVPPGSRRFGKSRE